MEASRVADDLGESVAPDGVAYAIPPEHELASSFAHVEKAAKAHRLAGGQVVVVQGLGFVGSAVAAAIAAARDEYDRPVHFVIGVDLPTREGYWKVARISEGKPPFISPDPALPHLVERGVCEVGNLCATTSEQAYSLADVIVVDVHLDVEARTAASSSDIRIGVDGFEGALRAVGRNMRPDALVVVETTVPIGACERIAAPILREERARRGIEEPLLLAHAYERVMPGPRYVDSIRAYPRSFAGIDPESATRARAFLASFMDEAGGGSLWELGDTVSSELGKVLENSYRSLNIAFIHEWTLLAEEIGINLFDVVDSVRVRTGTHDNMRYPGFGVGGYCLTKDSFLAQWGAAKLFDSDAVLGMTLASLRTNYEMPLHTLDLVREAAGGDLAGRTIAVCGVSYIADVADTRNSPAEVLVDGLLDEGARVRVHDPHVVTWPERPQIPIQRTLSTALRGADGVVFAVPHGAYLELASAELVASIDDGAFVIDAQDILDDAKASALHEAGRPLLGVGKGHWRRRGHHVRR